MIDRNLLFIAFSDPGMIDLQRQGLASRPSYDCEVMFIQPLRRVFREVHVFELWRRYAEVGPDVSNRELIDAARRAKADIVLWPTMMYEMLETTIPALHELGCDVVGWFFDDEVRFNDYSVLWTPFLAGAFTNDPTAVARYCARGLPAVHVVMGSNPVVYRRLDLEYEYDVSFVGKRFGDRAEWVDRIRASGVRVEAFGDGWESGHLSTEEVVRIANVSRINLNFTKSYGVDQTLQMKDRFFHVAMAGGFLLSEYAPGIEDLFEPGKEIVLFHTFAEAVQLIRDYLSDERAREAIARAGWRRAHRDHTRDRRIEDAFVRLRVPMQASPPSTRGTSAAPDSARALRGQWHLNWARGLSIAGFPEERWGEEMRLAMLDMPRSSLAVRATRFVIMMPRKVRAPVARAANAVSALRAKIRIGARVRTLRSWARRHRSS